jgi:hypothetical protein
MVKNPVRDVKMFKRNLERMRYKNDKLASGLVLLSIVGNVVFFVSIYTNNNIISDHRTGVDIVINLLFLLTAFLASEEVKVYKRKWVFVVVLLAALQFYRVFWLPGHYLELEQLVGRAYFVARYSMLFSALAMTLAGVVCWINSTALRGYLKNVGAR